MGSGGITPPFLNPALDGDEWLASRSGRFTPEERATGTRCIGSWVDAVGKRKPLLDVRDIFAKQGDRKHGLLNGDCYTQVDWGPVGSMWRELSSELLSLDSSSFSAVNKFPALYGRRRFIAMFTKTRYLSLSQASSSLRFVLILSSYICADLLSGLVSLVFQLICTH
jgi:hypothetical protein